MIKEKLTERTQERVKEIERKLKRFGRADIVNMPCRFGRIQFMPWQTTWDGYMPWLLSWLCA